MNKTMVPKRVKRERTKGWRMPPNTVYVGRPSKWGNPYQLDMFSRNDTQIAVDLYRKHIEEVMTKWPARKELKGKNLACWCKLNEPCHADILLEIANN